MNRTIETNIQILPGKDLTSATLESGEVSMEQHPEYNFVIQMLEQYGYSFIFLQSKPESFFSPIKNSNELVFIESMSWFSLMQVITHIQTTELNEHNELRNWQKEVFPFHVSLKKFLLAVSADTSQQELERALKEVIRLSNIFWRRSVKKFHSTSRFEWVHTHFPDIFDLREQVHQIHQTQFSHIPGRIL